MARSAISDCGLLCASVVALAVTVGACGATTDSLGYNNTESKTLLPLTPPASYPNPFRDLLGQTDAAISAKLNNAFNTIFHGSPAYAIYINPAGTDQAYIIDTYHDNEIRTEGIGLGMMICVEFNKQDEFDKLWRYARDQVQNKSGPDAGYFPSFCDATGGTATSCLDPYGFEQFVTALIFANDRWGSTGAIDYAADALALFHTLRYKEADNGGVVGGVTNMFDAATNLPLDVPNIAAAGVTRPSVIMPGYYALWAEADADPVWTAAAERGRSFWQSSANATTGFVPVRAGLDGTPLPGWASFISECYRAQINVAIDQIWSGGDARNVTESNQLLSFFSGQGISTYGRTFSLDGTMVLDATHDPALVAANGIASVASTNTDRSSYVSAVWNLDFPTGDARYYSGILQMVALLILSGQFQVY